MFMETTTSNSQNSQGALIHSVKQGLHVIVIIDIQV